MAAKDKNVQPRVVSPIEVSPRLVEPKAIKYPFGGDAAPPSPSPLDDWWGLQFTMPNGGTVTLKKVGSPNEHSFEIRKNETSEWEPWEKTGSDFVIDLQAGESVYIRNVSKEFESLSKNGSSYWKFKFTNDVYASGSVMALCVNDKNFLDLTGANYCFYQLFESCSKLKQAPELPATILAPYCYNNMFNACSNLTSAPVLPAKKLEERCYFSMFAGCGRLNYIYANMIDISALECINGWTIYVASNGDFYCPAELTISVGNNGIPSGWTRHDI